jgi:streptomycin 6-kinase
MNLTVPVQLAATCREMPERAAWLDRLPRVVDDLAARWSIRLGTPYEAASCAWVAPALLANGGRADGGRAVLKIGMPHMEGEHELDGLRFWDGDPTVRLLAADADSNAMLLERCEPGTPLRALSESEQDVVIAGLLRRLWRTPSAPHPFRPLSTMAREWSRVAMGATGYRADEEVVREGVRLFEELPLTSTEAVLLATDLHAGNVLRAQREPWLVIDPKPFVGDPAYDATQHLLNSSSRLRSDPLGTIHRFSDLLGVDRERVRLWMFSRLAVEPRDRWLADDWSALLRALH